MADHMVIPCVIKKPEKPWWSFLRSNRILRVKEQYNRYAFGNALRIINSIEKETMEFIGFEGEGVVGVSKKECLRFYEVWG